MCTGAPRTRSRSPLDRDQRPRLLEGLEARRLSYPGGLSLDERISATWSGLVDSGSVECPVCAGTLQAGRACGSCGSELS